MPITRTEQDGVDVVRLAMPGGNAIDDALIEALRAVLDEVDRSSSSAAVITGEGRAFSTGLNLVEAFGFDRARTERFVDAFDGLFLRVLLVDKPLVAAINGHAIAGGCILAMAADYRVVAPGAFTLGVPEAQLGIPFPACAFEIARRATPPPAWAETLIEGKRFTPDEALAAGLVHRIAGERGVVAEAVEVARRLGSAPRDAARQVKADLLAPSLARIEATRDAMRARFVDAWHGPDARRAIGAMRDELLRKKAR